MTEQIHVHGCLDRLAKITIEGVCLERRHRCGGTYVCNRCERTCGWCFGAADDAPGICDDCLFEIGHVEDIDDTAWRTQR